MRNGCLSKTLRTGTGTQKRSHACAFLVTDGLRPLISVEMCPPLESGSDLESETEPHRAWHMPHVSQGCRSDCESRIYPKCKTMPKTVFTLCVHTDSPMDPNVPPSLNAPRGLPTHAGGEAWRARPCPAVAPHVGVVPPARVVVRRSTPSAQLGDSGTCRSSGRGSCGSTAVVVHVD